MLGQLSWSVVVSSIIYVGKEGEGDKTGVREGEGGNERREGVGKRRGWGESRCKRRGWKGV